MVSSAPRTQVRAAAFRQMAGGKDWLTAADVKGTMSAADAETLLAALEPYQDKDGGYDYTQFVRSVYGSGKAS